MNLLMICSQQNIYKGNVDDQVRAAKEYIDDYRKYTFKAKEAKMKLLWGKDLQKVAEAASETACGMDQ